MTTHLKGLTWDHPRAVLPLRAAHEPLRLRFPDIAVSWDVQPLAGFEARPMAESAAAYDLIIFDHPHVGEIATYGLLQPADEILRIGGVSDEQFVGPSLESYRYGGRVWGLPLDAACQVSCARPDLMSVLDSRLPRDWTGVLELGERALRTGYKLAIGYAGVHSLMVLLTLCANQGASLAMTPALAFADRSAVRQALAAMAELLRFCPREVLDWNSIAVQDAMCARDDLVLCPAVYGFSPYARRGRQRPLVYGNLPGLQAGSRGSTLGGAGIGISARSRHPDAAFAVASFLTEAPAQENIIALHDGQPARASAWASPEVNRHSGDFYSHTRDTIERAWVRPRFNGYLHFQRAGGEIVEQFLRGLLPAEDTLERLEQTWSDSLAAGGRRG